MKNNAQEDALIKNTWDKIEDVLSHVQNVQINCKIVAKKCIEDGELDFGRRLIANGQVHDNTKFKGIEWEYLTDESPKTKRDLAVTNHNSQNLHHPEAWGNIHDMPRIYIAEMVCDWKARATEFGSSLREWVDQGAMTRYGYKKSDRVYKDITFFVNLLCDKPFEQKEV